MRQVFQKLPNNEKDILDRALDAMEEFCRKVEDGEARSVRTYAVFLLILQDAGRRSK
jgi:hypothetical protein